MVTTLVRESVTFDAEKAELTELVSFDELAVKAAKFLGYRQLKDQLSDLKESAQNRLSLKSAIHALDLKVYSVASVDEYKNEMVGRATPTTTKVVEVVLSLILCLFGIALVAFVMGLIACVGCGLFTAGVPFWLKASTVAALIVAAVTFLTFGFSSDTAVYAEWVSIPIKDYTEAIPEFALQTAVDLKEKCSEAEFFIEELQLKKRPLDPFLVVCDASGNKYYLEVWNEPGFTQKR